MNLASDTRPIQSVTTQREYYFCVGREGVTEIKLCFENGQGAEVPWFAVYESDKITARINGAFVEYISYT